MITPSPKLQENKRGSGWRMFWFKERPISGDKLRADNCYTDEGLEQPETGSEIKCQYCGYNKADGFPIRRVKEFTGF